MNVAIVFIAIFAKNTKYPFKAITIFRKAKFLRQARQKLRKVPLFEGEFSTMLENKGHHCGLEKNMVECQRRLDG